MLQRAVAPRIQPAMQGTGIANQAALRRLAAARTEARLEREADAAAVNLVAGDSARVSATPSEPAPGPATPAGGAPLPSGHRSRLEAGLGISLGDVRLHTDAAANRVANDYAATALTFGRNIWFAHGAYAPDQPEGARLLAHEVAHIGQQARGGPIVQRQATQRSEEELELQIQRARASVSDWIYETQAVSPLQVAEYAMKLQMGMTKPGVTLVEVIPDAEELLVLYDALQVRAATAGRDDDGALLYTPTFDKPIPWAPARPHAVEEIEPFSAENVASWRRVVENAKVRFPQHLRQTETQKRMHKPEAAAQDEPHGQRATAVTMKKKEGMTFATPEGQQLIITALIAATRKGYSADQIAWTAWNMNVETDEKTGKKTDKWRPPKWIAPAGQDVPEWQRSIEDTPVGEDITIALFPSFQNELDVALIYVPSQRDFQIEGYRQGVLDSSGGVVLGLGVFGVGVSALTLGSGTGLVLGALDASVASVGAGTIGTELGVSVMGGSTGNYLLGSTVGRLAIGGYLNAPAVFGTGLFAYGAGTSAYNLYMHSQEIRARGFKGSDALGLVEDLTPLVQGASEYSSWRGASGLGQNEPDEPKPRQLQLGPGEETPPTTAPAGMSGASTTSPSATPSPAPTPDIGETEGLGTLRFPRIILFQQGEEVPPLTTPGTARPATGSQAATKPTAVPGTEGEAEAVSVPASVVGGPEGTTASPPAQGPISRPALTGLKGHILRSIFVGGLEGEPALGTIKVPGSRQTSGQVVKVTPSAPVTPSVTSAGEPTPPTPLTPSTQTAPATSASGATSLSPGPTEGTSEVPVGTANPTGPSVAPSAAIMPPTPTAPTAQTASVTSTTGLTSPGPGPTEGVSDVPVTTTRPTETSVTPSAAPHPAITATTAQQGTLPAGATVQATPTVPARAAPQAALPAGAPAPLALPGSRYHTLREILPDPARPFVVPDIESGYQAYVTDVTSPSGRVEWVRLTRGGPRALLVQWLGPNFPTAAGEPIYIRLGNIVRPPSLTDDRLAQLLGQVEADPAALTARYNPGSAAGPNVGEVNLANFNILKGNVGEILALPIRAGILANIRQSFPNARVYDGVRIRLPVGEAPAGVQPDLGGRLLFGDGVVAEEIGNDLRVYGVVETKSGRTGGQAATEQVFDWIEGRIEDGAQIVLPNGKSYTYDPARTIRNRDRSLPPRVIFLQSAQRHLISVAGAENLGEGTSMKIARPTYRYALPATAEEINYLTRLQAERLAAPLATTPTTPTPAPNP